MIQMKVGLWLVFRTDLVCQSFVLSLAEAGVDITGTRTYDSRGGR